MSIKKKLQFTEETLKVLQDLVWSDDGLQAVIVETLDRATYQRVAKALKAMGGKWSKSDQATLFDADPRDQVEGLIETGTIEVIKDGFFETPVPIILKLIKMLDLTKEEWRTKEILEPSAGNGAIIKHLLHKYMTTTDGNLDIPPKGHIEAVEINSNRIHQLRDKWSSLVTYNLDFLKFEPLERYDVIIMNPPFEQQQDIDHVTHAFNNCLKVGGKLASVMADGAFFRMNRKAKDFRYLLEKNYGYSRPNPEGSFKTSGTGVNTRCIVMEK